LNLVKQTSVQNILKGGKNNGIRNSTRKQRNMGI